MDACAIETRAAHLGARPLDVGTVQERDDAHRREESDVMRGAPRIVIVQQVDDELLTGPQARARKRGII